MRKLFIISTFVLAGFSGCVSNQAKGTDDGLIVLEYYGLYGKSEENDFVRLKTTDIIPRNLSSRFGIFVYSKQNKPIDVIFNVYAKKYKERNERLMLTNTESISSTTGYNQLIKFTEENDFQYEYWVFQVIYKGKSLIEQTFRLED